MRRTVFLVILFSKLFVATAQDLGALGPSRIIGPSPEPSRIARYGSYDVSYYTGKPQIRIPVYNIKTTDLEVPVNLTYEATGVRLDEMPSWTGTGWMLNAGGMITRVIVDNPDEFSYGYLELPLVPYEGTTDQDFLYNAAYRHVYDTEPDTYYFVFNGRSGQFTFDRDKNIFQIPVSGLKITPIGGGFQIVDEQGNTYEFSTAERSQGLVNGDNEYQPFAPTTWWLTKITSAGKTDVINFSYATDAAEEREDRPNYSAVYGPKIPCTQCEDIFFTPPVLESSNAVMTKSWYAVRLSSIEFNNGKLVFNKVSDRLDGGQSRLESIDIYNKVNGVFNKMRSTKLITDYFHYSGQYKNTLIFYSDSWSKYRLKLQRLEDYDQNGSLIGKHQFEYNTTELPFRGSCQQDSWGYYNGQEVNDQKQTLLPQQYTDDLTFVVGGANRDPNEQFMKAGVLTKVIYPTGGYSVFNWEAHKYLYNQQTIDPHSIYCAAFGNNSNNDPHPLISTNITLPQDDNATVTIDLPHYQSVGPYANPAYNDSAELTRPSISIYNVATGERVFYRTNANPSTDYYDMEQLYLPAGTYQLVSKCFVNSVNAKAAITVQWHTTRNERDVRLAGGLRIAD
ncbi:MAG TPA: hypothetical protein VF008_25040, partial [Niastella sp.]